MTKYSPLSRWLRGIKDSSARLTFAQIETILGDSLPASARKYSVWWANEKTLTTHVQCKSWLDAGFETQHVDLAQQTLDFQRV